MHFNTLGEGILTMHYRGWCMHYRGKTELDHFTKNMDDGEGVSRPIMGNFHMFMFII